MSDRADCTTSSDTSPRTSSPVALTGLGEHVSPRVDDHRVAGVAGSRLCGCDDVRDVLDRPCPYEGSPVIDLAGSRHPGRREEETGRPRVDQDARELGEPQVVAVHQPPGEPADRDQGGHDRARRQDVGLPDAERVVEVDLPVDRLNPVGVDHDDTAEGARRVVAHLEHSRDDRLPVLLGLPVEEAHEGSVQGLGVRTQRRARLPEVAGGGLGKHHQVGRARDPHVTSASRPRSRSRFSTGSRPDPNCTAATRMPVTTGSPSPGHPPTAQASCPVTAGGAHSPGAGPAPARPVSRGPVRRTRRDPVRWHGARLGGVDKASLTLRRTNLPRHRRLRARRLSRPRRRGGSRPGPPGLLWTAESPAAGGPAAGLLAGLRAGLEAGPAGHAGPPTWVVALAVDMPLVTAETIRRLCRAARAPMARCSSTRRVGGSTCAPSTASTLCSRTPRRTRRACRCTG